MRIFTIPILFFLSVTKIFAQGGGCVCTNCPQFMPDGFTGSFLINVQNAANNQLGVNNGVCGVNLNFNHEYLGDLSMVLTSPSGQSVTLVGPIGFFGPTDFTTWDVSFVPCATAAAPDPGFSATWNNNQPWGLSGNYTGSYHPYLGCLENFNTGPVNGTWTLTVTDGQAVDVGNFFDYEIIFCDGTGINCFSCAANAGNLLQNDVTACEGANTLNLNLPPSYPSGQSAPPAAQYSYTYVVAGAGGVIVAYETGPDLTSYSTGVYTVCGMSYATEDEDLIPAPNGTLTIATLSAQLSSTQPPFCGKITTNCVNVTINPAPPNEEETIEVCQGECVTFHNQLFCAQGSYVLNLTQSGCPYTATLNLIVNPAPLTFLTEGICPGECSQNPAFDPPPCMPGSYIATVQTPAGCDSTINLTISLINVVANIQPPPSINCTTPTVQLSGSGSSTGAGVTYLWTASGTGHIVGVATNINVLVDEPGEYTLEVCKTIGGNVCCVTETVTVEDNSTPPSPSPGILGDDDLCVGQTTTFVATAPGPGFTYNWQVPAGVVINGSQHSTSLNVTWNSPTGGTICVTAVNSCGESDPTCIDVMVHARINTGPIAGNNAVCVNEEVVYSVPGPIGNETYTWSVPPPAVLVSGQGTESITVNWGNSTGGNICVTAINDCGAGLPACLPVTVTNVPPAPNISGSPSACSGVTGVYSVIPVPAATDYVWEITNGTLISGAGTSSVTVQWDAGATFGQICVTTVVPCGESAPGCFNVSLSNPPAEPEISGNDILCSGTNGSYSVQPVPGATSYTWTVTPGATIVSGQNTSSVVVNWGSVTSGSICATANGSCGPSQQICYPVTIDPMPVANAGANGSVCGLTYNLNAISSVPGSSGTWSQVSGPGSSAFANSNAFSTSVTVSTFGVYLFDWVEEFASCSNNDQVTIDFNDSPVAGQTVPTCDATQTNYTITFPITGGTPGYSAIGGTVAGSSFTSNPIPSGTAYSFTITDANGCTSAAISGNHNCQCATNAGTMMLTPLSACENENVTATHNGNETLDGDDTGAFYLHNNSGTTLGTVYGQNNTGVFGFQPGMTYGNIYYISFVAGNNMGGFPELTDPCLSVSQGEPVVFYQNPTANAGPDAATCGLVLDLAANAGPGFGTWTVTSAPAGGTLTFSNNQSGTSSITADLPGSYMLNWTLDNNGCADNDQVTVVFNQNPMNGQITKVCDGAQEFYTVSFPITTGASPFVVPGGTVTAGVFTSNPIASGTPYSFTITDGNGCTSNLISGNHNCLCASNAGTMELQTLTACEGQTVAAQHFPNAVLDANDIGSYVIHEGNGTTLVNPIAQNATGVFGFQAGMVYGQTYYVSFVVGNNVAGIPDVNDPCLSVAQGQPVRFFQNPVANAGADMETCGLQVTLSGQSSTFQGSWMVSAGPAGNVPVFSSGTAANSDFSANLYGAYTLVWNLDNNGCMASDEVVVHLNESPQSGILVKDCDAANENYTVVFPITGGVAPFTVPGGTVSGNTFTSNSIANNAPYSFTITDGNGCTSTLISGSYNCNCATNAGTMNLQQLTACAGASITVTGNGDENFDANDIGSYILHEGSGNVIVNPISQNTTGVFDFQSGMVYGQQYFVSFVAGNNQAGLPDPTDPCFSVAPGQPIIFYQNATPDAGTDDANCGLDIALNAANSGLSGTWQLGSGPGGATFSDPTNPASTVDVSVYGTYTFVWEEDNNGCKGTDAVEMVFNATPVPGTIDEICNSTNTEFNVIFNVAGGQAPYTVTGLNGSFSGTQFTSDLLTSNTAYNFSVTDQNGCETPLIAGIHDCLCLTNSGSMNANPITVCEGDMITAVWNNDGVLDGDDGIQFILHDGGSNAAGTIYATSDQPTFGFQPNMTFGSEYYISAIAGNQVLSQIDLNDPCLSVAVGTPVIWKAKPNAYIVGDAIICSGDTTSIVFHSTGNGPFDLEFTIDGVSNLLNGVPDFAEILVFPTTTTVYQLDHIVDGTLPACSADLTESVTVTVNTPVSASVEPATEICNNPAYGSTLDFSSLVIGGDMTGTWVGPTGVGSGAFPQLDFNGAAPGTYTFTYSTTAALAPCPNPSYNVSVTVKECLCPPVTTLTPPALCNSNGVLNLDDYVVTIFDGVWTVTSAPVGTNPASISGNTLTASGSDPGQYMLTFTLTDVPPAGCPDHSVQSLTIQPGVSAGIASTPLQFCEKTAENVALLDLLTNADPGGTWVETSLVPSTGNAFNANLGTFQTAVQSAGTYTFKYLVDGNAPCPDAETTVTIIINPNPKADAGPDQVLDCTHVMAQLGGVATSVGPEFSYQWFFNNDTIVGETNALLAAVSPGNYVLEVLNQATGCMHTDLVNVNQDGNIPVADLISVGQVTCFGYNDGFISVESVAGGTAPLQYSINGSPFRANGYFAPLGAGQFVITIKDNKDCFWVSDSIEIVQPEAMSITLGPDLSAALGDTVTVSLQILNTQAALDTIIWSPLMNPIFAGQTYQTYFPIRPEVFEVLVIDENGCTATDRLNLNLDKSRNIYIPNIFAPGSDGPNSILYILGGQDVELIQKFQMFDRWGEMVFEKYNFQPNDPTQGWDGTLNGKIMTPAVFVYFAEVKFKDGKTVLFKGDVTLQR